MRCGYERQRLIDEKENLSSSLVIIDYHIADNSAVIYTGLNCGVY